MSYLEANRQYRVTTATGEQFRGYIRREGDTVHVFRDCVRLISSALGPESYAANPPTNTSLTPVHLLASVQGPWTIEPLMALTPVEQLPYGAVCEGTWYRRIVVPYVSVPANMYAAAR
jgi:hypothetical protein